MSVVGIDPGLNGALAVLGAAVTVWDAPRLDVGKGMLDAALIVTWLRQQQPDLVVVEKQQAMPRFRRNLETGKSEKIDQGVVSSFTTGYGFGLYVGILEGLGLRYAVVAPQAWQKELYAGMPGVGKERSLLAASRLWPHIKIPKSKHGRADSLLIAEFGRRRFS